MIALNEVAGTEPLTLSEIETKTKAYAAARSALAEKVKYLTDLIDQLKREALPDLKKAVARCAERHAVLAAAITASPQLFEKPRTVVFDGIKIGWRKGTGGIDWDDDARVCDLIEKHFTEDEAGLMIKTTRKPITAALKELEVADIKKIGCRVEGTADVIVIKPTDSEVEKTITALLKGAIEETEPAA